MARPSGAGVRGRMQFAVDFVPDGYAVFDQDGRRIGDTFRFRGDAIRQRDELQREADLKAKRGPRACLCCGAVFESEGIHNRLCVICRRKDAGEQSQRPQIERRRA